MGNDKLRFDYLWYRDKYRIFLYGCIFSLSFSPIVNRKQFNNFHSYLCTNRKRDESVFCPIISPQCSAKTTPHIALNWTTVSSSWNFDSPTAWRAKISLILGTYNDKLHKLNFGTAWSDDARRWRRCSVDERSARWRVEFSQQWNAVRRPCSPKRRALPRHHGLR